MSGLKTYNDIHLDARNRLRAEGIEAYNLEAWLIIQKATGKTREEFLRDSQLFATDGTVQAAVEEMIARRLHGEPVAYITGEWEFYGLPIAVDDSVLIPRVDTEVLAGEAIRLVQGIDGQARVLDLCAGSGCVGLAIAANAQPCRVLLGDISRRALSLCRANAIRNGLTRSVTAIELNVFKNPPALLGGFDVIVCNPPYIPTADILALEPSVRDYEPHSALNGGEDGLDFYRTITERWTGLIRPGGFLAFECGSGQADDLRDIMFLGGLRDIYTRIDTLGIERVVAGRISEE